MKEIKLRVPEDRYEFVMELINGLGLEVAEDLTIPEWHKKIVEERIEEYRKNPDSAIPWEEARKKLRFKD
jgi:hypothetical protein